MKTQTKMEMSQNERYERTNERTKTKIESLHLYVNY